jgi:putative salt-induced outer membrane protein YdiY
MNFFLRTLSILLLNLALMTGICAQEKANEENQWGGDASVGFALARGNTDTTSFSLTLSVKGSISESVNNSNKGFFILNKEKNITNAESMGWESQIDWEHTERFFSYFEILALRDRFKNHSYRIRPSVGIGYQVMTSEKIQLSAVTGISEVFTKYYDTSQTDSYTGIELGNQFSWKISESAEFTQALGLTADLSELDRYFLRLEASIASAIAKGLSLKLTLMENYDNKPVGEKIKKNDISFLAGLSAKF